MTDRRLIVMRHGKSSWTSGVSTDHARPLNDRGRHDSPRVAARLTELGWQPDFILSSDAQRNQETALAMKAAWDDDVPTEFLRSLYLAGYDELVSAVALVPDNVSTLLVLGHNPGWSEVVQKLTGEMIVMKTATAALLTAQGDTWSNALRGRGEWHVTDVIYPREL